jgi:hypothetical protein
MLKQVERHWSNVAVMVIIGLLAFFAKDCLNSVKENSEALHRLDSRVVILETNFPHVAKSLEDMSQEVKRIRILIERSRDRMERKGGDGR